MDIYHAKEIVSRVGGEADRITWDAADENGDFPQNELAYAANLFVVATDDVGNFVPITRWEDGAPVAEGASWVFYFD